MEKPGRRAFIVWIVLIMVALVASGLIGPLNAGVSAKGKPDVPPGQAEKGGDEDTTYLHDIDSGLTSPTGDYRWLDVANQIYKDQYINKYNYTKATVGIQFNTDEGILQGGLTAKNLKPNFTYQVKLAGNPQLNPEANENIGFAGRWWQETWNGSAWTGGQNLNNKGDTGSSPNPNDEVYFSRKDIPDLTSPTGLKYRYTGYMVFDYITTDDRGNASFSFTVDNSYHVLWKTTQSVHTASDGPVKTRNFDVKKSLPAYDVDYPPQTVSIFGEWERLPVDGVFLAPGTYNCKFFLTEESFHGGGGTYAGNWAAAMGAPISFEIPAP